MREKKCKNLILSGKRSLSSVLIKVLTKFTKEKEEIGDAMSVLLSEVLMKVCCDVTQKYNFLKTTKKQYVRFLRFHFVQLICQAAFLGLCGNITSFARR